METPLKYFSCFVKTSLWKTLSSWSFWCIKGNKTRSNIFFWLWPNTGSATISRGFFYQMQSWRTPSLPIGWTQTAVKKKERTRDWKWGKGRNINVKGNKRRFSRSTIFFKLWTWDGKWVLNIPDICQFWHTTALFRPVKTNQFRAFYAKHCQRHYGPRRWLLWPVILVR